MALQPASTTIAYGGNTTVTVDATAPSQGLGAWTVDITYDASLLSATTCTPENGSLCNPTYTADTVRITGSSLSGLSGTQTIATITFSGVSAGTSALTTTIVTFADPTGANIPSPTVSNGSIVVSPPPPSTMTLSVTPTNVAESGTATVSGAVYGSGNTPIKGETVDLSASAGSVSPSQVTTASDGSFSASFTAGSAPGLVTIHASVSGTSITQTAALTVTVGPPASETITLNPTSIGVSRQVTISGTVSDSGNNPIGGVQVDLSTSGGTLANSSATTNGTGTYTDTLTAPTTTGTVTVTATVHGTTITKTSNLTVVAGTAASLNVGLSSTSVQTGGSVTVSGAVYDQYGNPVGGATVHVSATNGVPVSASVTSGSDGSFSDSLNGLGTPGQVTVTASVPNTSASNTATLTVIPPPITIQAFAPVVVEGGQVTVSGAVYDSSGNALPPPQTVYLSTSGASGTVSPSQTVTSSVYGGGYEAIFTAGTAAGAATVTASVYVGSTLESSSAVVLIVPSAVKVASSASSVSFQPGGSASAAVGSETVLASNGQGTVKLVDYAAGSNPVGAPSFVASGDYFDLSLAADSTFTSITLTRCSLNGATTAYWWNGTSWASASDQSLSGGCITVTIDGTTSPNLTQLSGTPFAVGTPPSTGVTAVAYAPAAAAPTVTGVNPASGPAAGGTDVTISGSGFTGATAVMFGSVAATSYTVQSDTEIAAVSPAGSAGTTVDVTIVTPAGTSAVVPADHFAYMSSATVTFSDVPASFWAYRDIETLAAKGIVNGFPDGTFQPNAPVTRAQFAKMLALTLGFKPGDGTTQFLDVTASDWFAPYVSAVAQAGLVNGISATEFGPNEPLTREQMAVLIARAGKLTNTVTLTFSDTAQIDAWALTGVEETVAAGYMNGFPNGSFQPFASATRAQAAKVLAILLSKQTSATGSGS